MLPAKWTTTEQYLWLQEQFQEYTAIHDGDKEYTLFWPKIYLYWFSRWPERAILFPGIANETMLEKEQQTAETDAVDSRKAQLQTWFRWRTNASKKNRGLKKDTSVFEAALVPKSRVKSTEEIYMDMVYSERIKPLVKAEQEAGNISTAGQCMALSRRFCKELLEDESDEVKEEVRERYSRQKKVKRVVLDDEDDNDETDADAIAKAIDDLPIICQRFARLIKKKTRFIVSFMCAGPEPRHDWDIVSLSCHPSETPAGSNFSQLCPDKDNTFLAAYQQYAELIFPANKRDPLLPGVGDGNEIEELEGCDNGEEDMNGGCDGSMDWNIPGFATSSDASMMSGFGNTEAGISDASSINELDQSVFNSEAQSNASFEQAEPDALSGFGNTKAGISDALLNELDQSTSNSEAQSNVPFGQAQTDASLAQAQLHASFDWHNISTLPPDPTSVDGMNEVFGSSFSHADLIAMGFLGGGSTMPNPFPPAFSSFAPSLTDARSTVPGYYDMQHDTRYGTMWNFSNLDSQGWEMPSLSSFLSSPISAERTTTTAEQDEVLPHFTRQSPILPAANHPADDSAEDLDSIHTGAGLPKSKRKHKLKLPAAKVNCNPAIEPTPTITPPMNTAKPKAKPKAKPLTKSGAVTETSHATADKGNTLGHLTAPNTATKRNPAVDIGAAPRVSKRIPIKSRRNDVADTIGSGGSTFVGIGREDPPVLGDVGASMMKCPPNLTMGSVIPAKKRRTKA
ncbi:uncharacterized protein HD556DRAFT_1306588 [Suillus plorans]|uniref:Uncharacterized protein n=1 Tax=Suillus plorans TaxID=116603 RepID=A0A9P7DL14_9AGAM|nr:uncharacterized protein HD556DRAFT_1306588 [Suillus plorans]KAG1797447.1 hypothetical protein HD556DRAFT_1306588 [Suillus plorans]